MALCSIQLLTVNRAMLDIPDMPLAPFAQWCCWWADGGGEGWLEPRSGRTPGLHMSSCMCLGKAIRQDDLDVASTLSS